MNTLDGGARLVEASDNWCFPDNGVSDVAVLPWAPDAVAFRYKHIPREMFASDDVVRTKGIGIGDDLLVAGLFTERCGRQQNAPIVRSGIIAGMPDEPLQDENTGENYHAYLAEVRSIGGLSGSPVFAILGPARAHNGEIQLSREIFLLGLIRGHWDYRRSAPPVDFQGRDMDSVNMGIAIVTPIQEALALIDGQELLRQRRRKDRELAVERAAAQHAGSSS